jgi:hypothetical protein
MASAGPDGIIAAVEEDEDIAFSILRISQKK